MNMMKNKYITFPSIGVVLLLLIQLIGSWYFDYQAGQYVSRIHGEYVGEMDADGIKIKWAENTDPPNCPVTLEFVWFHESGLATIEPSITLSAIDHIAIASTKNGHVSWERPVDQDVINTLRNTPGIWEFQIKFKFDCSIVKHQWINWIDFNNIYSAAPVILHVE